MRTNLPAGFLNALATAKVVKRSAIWITAKDRSTQLPVSVGFWNGLADATFSVVDGITRSTVPRSFVASGSMIGLDDIQLTSDLTVREITVNLSPINDAVENAVRGYDAKFAAVQIYRVLLDVQSRLVVGAGYPRFVGFVNGAPIVRAAAGENSSIGLSLVSQLRELTKSNPDVRSTESQQARSSTGNDNFYANTDDVGHWIIPWGQRRSKIRGHHGERRSHAKD